MILSGQYASMRGESHLTKKVEGKGKVHPITGHEGQEVEVKV